MTLLSLIFLTSFGVWALPQTVHKYYAIRDKRAIKQGTVVSTVFALVIGFGAYFVGALYKLYQPDIEAFLAEKGLSSLATNSDIFIPVMLKLVIPTALIGIIAVLILSASMSTLSSVSLASASVVAVDLYKGKINKGASDKRTNMIMKALCVAFIVISVVLAILNEEFGISAIAYMMGLSWGTLAGCFIGPFVLGVTWKKTTKQGAWASIVGSLVLTVALIFILGYAHPSCNGTFGSAFKAGVSCSPMIGSICMIFSVLVTVIVSLLTKAPSE
jgi:Na+/proline symporter